MRWHLWGADFRRTSSEFRTKLFIPSEKRLSFFHDIYQLGFKDLIYVSTCNRVEFYTTADNHFEDTRQLWLKLMNYFGLDEEAYYLGFHLEGKSAFRHLMRVASSLESLMVGEAQILGQLKEALQFVKENQLPLDNSLERSFQAAFEVAKKVRTQTVLSEKPVSVASLGFHRVESMKEAIPLEKVVVVGRGPISKLVIQWLKKNHSEVPIVWVNRTPELIQDCLEAEGVAIQPLHQFIENPESFSHLFTATSSVEPLFTNPFFEKVESSSPKLAFDFAHPRDIVVENECFPNLTVVPLESLREESQKNIELRKTAIFDAEVLLEEAMATYCMERKEAPYLKEFNAVEGAFFNELEVALNHLRSEIPSETFQKVERWAEKLLKKNLHLSREHLKEILQNTARGDSKVWMV